VLPDSVLVLLGSAEFFNLGGNSFSNIQPDNALFDMVYNMTNWRDRPEVIWANRGFAAVPENIGAFRSLVKLDLSRNNELTGVHEAQQSEKRQLAACTSTPEPCPHSCTSPVLHHTHYAHSYSSQNN
jgi:hypothetical protein